MFRTSLFSLAVALGACVSAPTAHAITTLNIAKLGTASESSTAFGSPALAIDGGTNGIFFANIAPGDQGGGSTSHTDNIANSFWQVSLPSTTTLNSVTLHNRADCCGGRLSNFRLSVLDAANVEVFGMNVAGPVPQGGSTTFALPANTVGKTVKVQLNGLNGEGNGVVSITEAVVLGSTSVPNFTNVARAYGIASQSSTDWGGTDHRAIDGNTNGNYGAHSTTHTNDSLANNFWMVDLTNTLKLENIQLFNRTDCCAGRLSNYRVSVLDGSMAEVFGQNFAGPVSNIALPYGTEGRFVRVQLNGFNGEGNGVLSLAEVQVMGGELFNVARNPLAVASQSTTAFGGDAARAIDGNTDGVYFGSNSVSHTDLEAQPYWEVALGNDFRVDEIILFNRAEVPERLSDFRVSLFDGLTEVFGQNFAAAGSMLRVDLPGMLTGDRVRIQLNGTNYLSLAEVQVFGAAAATPEPASLMLGLIGTVALAGRRRRAA